MEKLKSLKDIVIDRFEEYKDNVAFIEKNNNNAFCYIKYSKLKQDILSLGTALYAKEELRGKMIAVIGENSSKWFITYMSVICGVGVIVPLDKELPKDEIINLIKRSDIKMLVYSNKKEDIINEIKKSIPKRNILYVKMERDESQDLCLDDLILEGKDLLNKGNNEYVQFKVNFEAFSALIFTSGTSSKSKGVMLSHKNLTSNINSICSTYKDIIGKRFISFLPMHHTYEFMITYLCMLSTGGTVGISRGLRYLMEDLKIIRPECICCVPLLVENIEKKIRKSLKKQNKENLVNNLAKVTSIFEFAKTDLRRGLFKEIHEVFGGKLRYILCGAASLDVSTIKFMENLGFVVLQGYGLTEASPLVSGTRVKNRAEGTVGTSINDVEVRIDITDKEENTGEIIVKGNNVMMGYFQDDEETKKVLKKGWLYTGDLGKFDQKGNLVITGRQKNVIVAYNGKNIYPEEIENKINKIPLVNESMIYGYIDENKKMILTAKVTLDEDYIFEKYEECRPSDSEIYDMIWNYIKEINKEHVPYKAIKRLEIKKDEFIKTTTLKIKRNEELKNNKKDIDNAK